MRNTPQHFIRFPICATTGPLPIVSIIYFHTRFTAAAPTAPAAAAVFAPMTQLSAPADCAAAYQPPAGTNPAYVAIWVAAHEPLRTPDAANPTFLQNKEIKKKNQ